MLTKILNSMLSAGFATIVYLVSSRGLDYFMDGKTSNLISLILAATFNFFFQKKTFMKKVAISHKILFKYLIAEVLIISFEQVSVSFLINNKKNIMKKLDKNIREKIGEELYLNIKKEYNTIIRIFAACFAFAIISFPIRHFWVFKI